MLMNMTGDEVIHDAAAAADNDDDDDDDDGQVHILSPKRDKRSWLPFFRRPLR
jgi:hypothetical protein